MSEDNAKQLQGVISIAQTLLMAEKDRGAITLSLIAEKVAVAAGLVPGRGDPGPGCDRRAHPPVQPLDRAGLHPRGRRGARAMAGRRPEEGLALLAALPVAPREEDVRHGRGRPRRLHRQDSRAPRGSDPRRHVGPPRPGGRPRPVGQDRQLLGSGLQGRRRGLQDQSSCLPACTTTCARRPRFASRRASSATRPR